LLLFDFVSLVLLLFSLNGVLGSPIGFTTGRWASPAWMIASLQIMQRMSDFQCTYKREHGRLHLYDEPAIALLYSHIYTPALK
jgi:hypothetical protein